MTPSVPALCYSCTRLRAGGKCAAFPDGIPAEIIDKLADHRKPIDGDHGIRYDPDLEHAALLAAYETAVQGSATTLNKRGAFLGWPKHREHRDWTEWDLEHEHGGGRGANAPVAHVSEGSSGLHVIDQLERSMGMHIDKQSSLSEHFPDRYEPNKGFSEHLKVGATETRIGTDEQGHPILYDVKGTHWDDLPGTAPEKLRMHDGGGMPMTGPDDKPIINVRVPGSERPAPLFRTMSEEEWQSALKNGFIQSDGRMNLVSDEGTVASVRNTGTFYMVPGENRIVRIEQEPGDTWRTDHDGYQKTNDRIPIDRVSMVSPVLNYPGPLSKTPLTVASS